MYRRFIIIVFFVLFSVVLVAQKYKLDVQLDGLNATFGNFVIYDPYLAEGIKVERIPVENGHYVVEGECSYPMITSIVFDDNKTMKLIKGGFIPCKSALLWAVVEPGKALKIRGKTTTFHDVNVEDNGENQKLSEINKRVIPLINEWGDLQVQMNNDTTLAEEERDIITEKIKALDAKVIAIQKDMITKDPSSVAALWLLDEMFTRNQVTVDEVIGILKSVDKKYIDHPYYLTLMSKIEGAKNAVVGKLAPE